MNVWVPHPHACVVLSDLEHLRSQVTGLGMGRLLGCSAQNIREGCGSLHGDLAHFLRFLGKDIINFRICIKNLLAK